MRRSVDGRGGDLPPRLRLEAAFLRTRAGCKVLLLQDEGFAFVIRLDELHRDQQRPRPEEADPHPEVYRLPVEVREHLLRATDLLAYGVVDRITGAPLGFRRP